jgi:hypothetical protein
MITSYEKNDDGTVTFKDENGMVVLNAPADHPMVSQKIAQLASTPTGSNPNMMALNMPGRAPMGPAVENGKITPTMALAQQGLDVPEPTTVDRQRLPGGQFTPPMSVAEQYGHAPYGMPGSAYGFTPNEYGKKKGYGSKPFGAGMQGPGFQAAASRGMHSFANALAGDRGAKTDPAEEKAYREAHARMAQERAFELQTNPNAVGPTYVPPAGTPARMPTGLLPGNEGAFAPKIGNESRVFVDPNVKDPSKPNTLPEGAPLPPGMRRDPATGAIIPILTDDERTRRDEEGLGG